MKRSQILTDRQQQELNKAILQYLEPILTESSSEQEVYRILQQTLVPSSFSSEAIVDDYLEKKWSTVLRLQRKIIDLEKEVGTLRSIVDGQQSVSNGAASVISKDRINWLPNRASKSFPTQQNQLVMSSVIHPVLPVIFGGCSDGSIIVWNIVNDDTSIPEKIIKAHTRPINKLAFSVEPVDLSKDLAKSKTYIFASCSADLSIKVWESSSYRHIRTLTGHDHTVSSVAFSQSNPDHLYSVSRDKTVKIWDLVNGYCVKSFTGHSEWVRDIDVVSINSQLSLNNIKTSGMLGDFVLTCSNDQSVRVSHAESGAGLALLIGHTHVIEKAKFLPVTFNPILDKFLKENQAQFPSIPQELVSDKIFTTTLGYKYCISGGRDNLLKLWLIPPPTLVPHRSPLPAQHNNSQGWAIADLMGHQSWVKAIAVHPNGRFIFSGSDDKTIKVWDLANLNVTGTVKCIRTLTGHDGFINDLDFAKFNRDSGKEDKLKENATEEELNQQLMKFIEGRMRCLFISGGADSSIKMWS